MTSVTIWALANEVSRASLNYYCLDKLVYAAAWGLFIFCNIFFSTEFYHGNFMSHWFCCENIVKRHFMFKLVESTKLGLL